MYPLQIGHKVSPLFMPMKLVDIKKKD